MSLTPSPFEGLSEGDPILDLPGVAEDPDMREARRLMNLLSLDKLPNFARNLTFGPMVTVRFLIPVLVIIFFTRLAQLVVDLVKPGSKSIKNGLAVVGGFLQLFLYLSAVQHNEAYISLPFLFSVIFVFALLDSVLALLRRTRHFLSRDLSPRFIAFIITSSIILYPMFYNEYEIHHHDRQELIYFRPILMTLIMKISHLAFRLDRDPPDFCGSLAYLVHPASCLFGPWHENQLDKDLPGMGTTGHVSRFRRQCLRGLKFFLGAIILLIVSELSMHLIAKSFSDKSIVSKVMSVYLLSQTFRFGHYFSTTTAYSFQSFWMDDRDGDYSTCDLMKIEWPRSLTEVITNWDIPMHKWLKSYAYEPGRIVFGNSSLAYLYTFAFSSALHGFKFSIWVTLFSLAILAWIEQGVREALAKRLNACVSYKLCTYGGKNNSCKSGHFKTPSNSSLTVFINFLFRLLAIAHLSYLGYISVGDSDYLTYRDGLEGWRQLYFYSPIIGFSTLLVTLLLKFC